MQLNSSIQYIDNNYYYYYYYYIYLTACFPWQLG